MPAPPSFPPLNSAGSALAPEDARLMRRALALARRARGLTYPNPQVGAVIARGGKILGEGYHHRAGEPHAEVNAIADCHRRGHSPRGATLYVTLEPCNHHGRTPPCTEAILAAGAARVVIGASDPNRAVKGGGAVRLAAAGLEVQTGALAREAEDLNEAFHFFHATGLPWVTLKWAMTLDGCVSTRTGHSQWITGPAARRDAHLLRARHGAVLIGVGTALADCPRLSVRLPRYHGPQPVRVVLDSRLRTPPDSPLFGETASEVWVATCAPAKSPRARRLMECGARLLHFSPAAGGGSVPIRLLLAELARRGIQSVLVEGGRRVAGAFFAERLVQRVVAYIAPALFGASGGHLGPLLGGAVDDAGQAIRLEPPEIRRLGPDVRLSARIAIPRE